MLKKQEQQFVIQEHTSPQCVHWDLMLEMGNILWTWRLNTSPADIGEDPVTAERIADHPLRFLTHEGPVQNNTARVEIRDKGTYRLHKQTENELLLELEGTILRGCFSLCRTENQSLWILQAAH
ncbi:MAG: hypothetical protein L0Y36_06210 [Planctomycetales bacterium]|nr:hypothetical protein [Planctomycetales bacterium]